jgi:hypothetical protein
MKQLTKSEVKGIAPIDIVEAINTGATIVNASFPFIRDLFIKVGELVKSVQTDKLSTPKGKRLAIEALRNEVEILQAQNELQKKFNSLLLEQLAANGIKISDTE